ncbi:MAG: YraN family protein [Peptococcaceae bacterium]|nr:YraN family protein [Peptococcaceae bacterium]
MEFRKQLGDDSEAIAKKYLEKKGYTFLQANFRCKTGEIDLIMQKENTIVFVEVRSRKSNRYGEPLETVNKTKQEKVRKAAGYYLYIHPQKAKCCCRFDVVSVLWKNSTPQITWLEDAFQ